MHHPFCTWWSMIVGFHVKGTFSLFYLVLMRLLQGQLIQTRMLISIVSHCIWFSLYFNYFMCMCKLVDSIALFLMRNDTNIYMVWEERRGVNRKIQPKNIDLFIMNKMSGKYISGGWIFLFTPGKTCVFVILYMNFPFGWKSLIHHWVVNKQFKTSGKILI